MKIGILTFHRSINNGAVVQCFSLSKRLKEEFPDSVIEVIDYHMPKIEKTYFPSVKNFIDTSSPINALKTILFLVRNPAHINRLKKRFEVFRSSLKVLPLSPKYIFSNEFKDSIDYINKNYDIVIVGSDAVWNYVSRGFPSIYFPNKSINASKLSYSASCYGMDFLSCEDNREKIGEILSDFKFLGVRDTATEDFVNWSGCGNKPYHTCDPTAFLDVDDLPINVDLLNKKLENKGFDFNKPTIGVMGNKMVVKMVRKFYGKKYQIAALYHPTKGADVQLYDLTPYEWAYIFRYFKITFTTFFHGTMLSLRNGVPAICITWVSEFSKKHTSKNLDLLNRLGFSDWHFHTDCKRINIDNIKQKSDQLLSGQYKDKIIEKMDAEAESFNVFKDALGKIINQ